MVAKISVKNLSMFYDDYVVMRNISFEVEKGEVFLIIGRSGCGKSSLLKYLMGLRQVDSGTIFYDGKDMSSEVSQDFYGKKIGVLYQSGALWSSMTLAENVALPFEMYTDLAKNEIEELVNLKLSLVGLGEFGNFYPSQISGGMKKRAGLARAMALDPEILFFDEPSAGLDPLSAKRLDDLIVELRESLGMTIVIVTHELASIFAIGTKAIYLDIDTKTATAMGSPRELLETSKDENVIAFLTRGVGKVK
ncbi:MAG: ATP-binding cassette domain-containing protein [Puniceicoccales bacterium]|jgi:phospholipid/cholesterol/gamma-HCH transport system ATP-binding protein|nr:ATP-binding cassette domain-containing protein [Puniceicoccales bacterium]